MCSPWAQRTVTFMCLQHKQRTHSVVGAQKASLAAWASPLVFRTLLPKVGNTVGKDWWLMFREGTGHLFAAIAKLRDSAEI